ncbi:MAG TPA: DUF4189 domain-containing protein [Xanthobacteraceae bacterium]|nr:DUF4189 domain-containing protein [Xanthobacteraceae bacterium]
MKISKLLAAAAVCCAVSSGAWAAGAIAVDDEEGTSARDAGYGIAVGKKTREDAAAAAMEACREEGNKSCRVAVRFDVCGAYAANKKVYGVGWGDTEAAAKRKAMDECGETSCKIVISGCDDD